MKFLKEWKLQSALYAVLYVILGAILLLFPETTATTLCYALGIAAVVAGVSGVFVYLFRDAARNAYRNDFVFGLVAILLGVFIFCKVELIISLIPFILGIVYGNFCRKDGNNINGFCFLPGIQLIGLINIGGMIVSI